MSPKQVEMLKPTGSTHPKTAIITGSSNGIGEAIAKLFAKLDYELVITGRSLEDINRVANLCHELSPSKRLPLRCVADLSDDAQVEKLYSESMRHLGNHLSVLVNNAGFASPVDITKPYECYESFCKTVQVNLMSTVKLSLLCGDALKTAARDSGETSSIINIGSINGFRPGLSRFAYATTKAAVHHFTEAAAIEWAPLIRVNCVAPGPIETKIIERAGFSLEAFKETACKTTVVGRIGQPEEVATCVEFLVDSAKASFVTGANIVVDGGAVIPIKFD